MSKATTKATAKYQAKIGLVAKTYKLKANIAEAFKAACEVSGESQAAVLMRFMTEYAEKNGSGKIEQTQLDGQMEINDHIQAVKCVRCGTINDGYKDGYFRCIDCEFGNYEPCDEDNADDEQAILEKWATQLKTATKKGGLPCVYQYDYGKNEPHIFVNNEKFFIPKDEVTVLIRLGAVHENKPIR